ncbi:MAG: hypothetical protein QOJ86_3478 [Bradyrhizobium sp.]|jgi:hypothetical protein|nr:hypothetical protein [Bradyrhizobium sp.]
MREIATQASTVDGATKIVQSMPDVQPARRLHGRSLEDFRDQETESRLLPAEEALLAVVTKGDLCNLGSYQAFHKLREEFRKATSDPEVIKLAAELVASPPRSSFSGKEGREALEGLEARIQTQPRVLREFLTELPGFAEAHIAAPKDLKSRVLAEPELLRPIQDDLKEQFESELWHWREVDPADPAVRVRAAFLRFLALGGDEDAPMHEKGLRLRHAFIDGELDLTACTKILPLEFVNCLFSKSIKFSGARLQRLNLAGSRVPAIEGVRCRTENSVFLDDGFLSLSSSRLIGAMIGGTLDCSGGTFRAGFNCTNIKVTGDVLLSSGFKAKGEVLFVAAEIGGNLSCSAGTFSNRTEDGRGVALNCNIMKVGGDVFLTTGFVAKGEVLFTGTRVGGDFGCANGTFENKTQGGKGLALSCNGAKIGGDMYLNSEFRSEGEVDVYGAEIGGALFCAKGTFRNRTSDGKGIAFNLQRIKVGGTVFLTDGFSAEGCVTLIGARIGGFLGCRGGLFDNCVPDKTSESHRDNLELPLSGIAIDVSNANIGDALWLGPSADYSVAAAKIRGTLDLTDAHARLLIDSPDGWPERIIEVDGKKIICAIALDGFTYNRLAEGAPADSERRKIWLSRQPPKHLRDDFRPQPFEQLIKVLREMGHERDAQEIAIAKLRIRRKSKLIKIFLNAVVQHRQKKWKFNPLKVCATMFAAIGLFFEWLLLDLLLGSGYAKARPILLFLIMLFVCAWYYERAAEQSAFVPTNPVIYNDPEVRRACAGAAETLDIAAPVDWYRCKKAPYELNPFRPLVYSIDQMIPFLQLGQKREWQPISRQLRLDLWGLAQVSLPASTTLALTWCQSIGSTMLYLLIAAILSGLIKRE